MSEMPSMAELIQQSQTISVDALDTLFMLHDYGEQGTMDMIRQARLISNMADNERIIKVKMLRGWDENGMLPPNSDLGKTVYIHHRSVGGTLTDVLDTKRRDSFYLAIDGRIYPVSGYDFIIISEPTDNFESQSVHAEVVDRSEDSDEGMGLVLEIETQDECTTVMFKNGVGLCSHADLESSNADQVPSLVRMADKV